VISWRGRLKRAASDTMTRSHLYHSEAPPPAMLIGENVLQTFLLF